MKQESAKTKKEFWLNFMIKTGFFHKSGAENAFDFEMRFKIVMQFTSYLKLPQRSTSTISLSRRIKIFE